MPTLSPGQAGDLTLIRSGAHKITVGTTVAGFTHGNVTITITANKRDVNVSEYGSTPADIEITGQRLSAKWTMIQRCLNVLDIALQGIYPLNYGSSTAPGIRGIGRSGIIRAQTVGQMITFHPITGPASGGTNEDVVFNKAIVYPTGNIEISDQGDQLFEVEADCVISVGASDGELLGTIGGTAVN